MKKLTLFLSLAILVAPPIQGIPSSDCANTVRSFPINFRQGKFVGPMLLLEFRTDHTLTLDFLGLPAYPRSPGTWVLENGTLLASADFSENFRRTCAGGCAEAFQDDTPARNKELSQCTNQCVTANISRFGKQQVRLRLQFTIRKKSDTLSISTRPAFDPSPISGKEVFSIPFNYGDLPLTCFGDN